jgi:hypothetical protein
MPGELKEYKNEQLERAMKAPINKEVEIEDPTENLRKKGLI